MLDHTADQVARYTCVYRATVVRHYVDGVGSGAQVLGRFIPSRSVVTAWRVYVVLQNDDGVSRRLLRFTRDCHVVPPRNDMHSDTLKFKQYSHTEK